MNNLRDTVTINKLQYTALLNNSKTNFEITTRFQTDFEKASVTDDLKYSINYAVVARSFKNFEAANQNKNYPTITAFANALNANVTFQQPCDFVSMDIAVKKQNYESTITLNRKRNETGEIVASNEKDKVKIQNLSLDTIIGIFTFERFKKQPVVLEIEIDIDLSANPHFDHFGIGDNVYKYIENSNFKTVEALVMNANKLIYKLAPEIIDCKVGVLKTNIIEFCDVGVSSQRSFEAMKKLGTKMLEFDNKDITTDRFVIPNINEETIETFADDSEKDVYIAFGSNQGHQLHNILQAIKELNEHAKIKVVQTSSLYKSKPMYFLDQPDFINGCLKLKTSLNPHELLRILKGIEYESLRRVKHFDNGPRTIDLDIILYGNYIINTPDLNIPHIRMIERSFVLMPLCELIPPDFIHPVTAEPVYDHLKQLMLEDPNYNNEIQESTDLISLVPLPTRFPMINEPELEDEKELKFRYLEYDLVHSKSPTQLMAILNVTPDSFSDGSDVNLDLATTMEKVDVMVANKVDIIDIGGCSTRPNSPQPTAEEELKRVLPVVKEIKKKYGDSVIISIDTYRSEVAEASIKFGADIINDISAGTFDEKMYDVVAKYSVPYVVNHTRGNIQTMSKLSNYKQTKDGNDIKIYNERISHEDIVVTEISKELAKLISKMYSKGIKRWQLILDPGLGFAKNLNENLSVIRNLPFMKKYKQYNTESKEFISFDYVPILLGPSRKKFIGTITGKETAAERINGTSASITAGIGFGADIVRVHDFKEMKDVCLTGDAIYKNLH